MHPLRWVTGKAGFCPAPTRRPPQKPPFVSGVFLFSPFSAENPSCTHLSGPTSMWGGYVICSRNERSVMNLCETIWFLVGVLWLIADTLLGLKEVYLRAQGLNTIPVSGEWSSPTIPTLAPDASGDIVVGGYPLQEYLIQRQLSATVEDAYAHAFERGLGDKSLVNGEAESLPFHQGMGRQGSRYYDGPRPDQRGSKRARGAVIQSKAYKAC